MLKTVNEAQADHSTRAVFEDIRSTMGVALVNLVWRRLAVNPSVLQWSWQNLKPHYQSGDIPAAAWLLRQQLEPPFVSPMSATERVHLTPELKNVSVIDDVLRTYERGNAQNLIALCLLQSCLDRANGRLDEQSGSPAKLSGINRLDTVQGAKELVDGQFGEIPGLPQMEKLSAENRLLVTRAADVWVPAKYKGLTPSVFRHLTYWPGVLQLFAHRLQVIDHDSTPGIGSVATQSLKTAVGQASMLKINSAGLSALNQIDRQWLQDVLEVFIDGMLARGVVIVPILRTLLSKNRGTSSPA